MGKKAQQQQQQRNHKQQQATTEGAEQQVTLFSDVHFDDIDKNDPANWRVTTGITPQTLLEQWHQMRDPLPIIAFYQDRKGNQWREFSNFYQHKDHGFDFVLPQELLDTSLGIDRDESQQQQQKQRREQLFEPIVHCEFSEKAIMLCKAAVMGNSQSYKRIANSKTPMEAKQLGRQITPWNDKVWETVVCGVAVSVIRQKFSTKVPALQDVLLETGDKILCEATAGDKRWACGISIKMPKVYEVPARWKGSNVLGWALMHVRQEIKRKMMEEQERIEALDNY